MPESDDLPQWPIDYVVRTNPPNHRPRRYVTIPLSVVAASGVGLVEMDTGSIPAGTPAYVDGSGSLQIASSTNRATSWVAGIVEETNKLRIGGVYETTGLTPGRIYWLGDGEYTLNLPVTEGHVVHIVGTALSETKLALQIREVVQL